MEPDQVGCLSGETHTGNQFREGSNESLPRSISFGMTVAFKGRVKAEQKHRSNVQKATESRMLCRRIYKGQD